MNFDEIKNKLAKDVAQTELKVNEKAFKSFFTENLKMIHNRMWFEIILQSITGLILLCTPFFIDLKPEPAFIFILFTILTLFLTSFYVLKMIQFMNTTKKRDIPSLALLRKTVYEIELTLEVYRTAVVSSCLTIAIAIIFFYFASGNLPFDLYEDFVKSPITPLKLLFILGSFLIGMLLFWLYTQWWIKVLYQKPLNRLKQLLHDLES